MSKRQPMYFQRAAAAGLVRGEQTFEKIAPARQVPRFHIPRGTKCAVAKVADEGWKEYVTTKPASFERFEHYHRTEAGNFYEFRLGGWLLLVHRRHVVHRDDTYRPSHHHARS